MGAGAEQASGRSSQSARMRLSCWSAASRTQGRAVDHEKCIGGDESGNSGHEDVWSRWRSRPVVS